MFNLVVLTGRLTADAELRHTQNDVPVCSFTIAVDRRHKADEEKQADFINIVAWRQTAQFVASHFKKGSMIGIEGAIQTRKYVDKDTGKNRTAFEVVANNVQFVEPKRSDNNADVIPFGSKKDPLVELSGRLDDFTEVATDEDLPF